MGYTTERDEDEIDEQRAKADEQVATGRSRWPGMTYEQGVSSTLAWLVGDAEDDPMED